MDAMDHEFMRRLHGGKGSKFEKISHQAALISKLEVARDTWLFRFEKPEGFSYRAGQHVRMSLLNPKAKDPTGNYRFWSFASAPHEPDLAFAIRMRSSPFKRELMSLQVGAVVQIDMLKNPPHGAFALDDRDSPVVFLAGGIGVVPAYSMIKEALSKPGSRQMTLFYSVRTVEDAPFLDELRMLAAQDSRFKFVPTLTTNMQATDWSGETGRISLDMIRRYVPDMSGSQIYISGLKGMVESLHDALIKSGIAASIIRSEEFGAFSTVHARGKSPIKALSFTGLALAAVIVAIHLLPVWLITNSHPLQWLKSHPVSSGAVAIILALVIGKIVALQVLRRHGKTLH
jgi:ferredoxin-NADP reductase